MKLNKNFQYGLMFVLYLSRAGRATIETASTNLNISYSLLQQVALKLKNAKVIKSIRGPNGGYELTSEPSVRTVFRAFNENGLIDYADYSAYKLGTVEQRALSDFVYNLQVAITKAMSMYAKSLIQATVDSELKKMDDAELGTVS